MLKEQMPKELGARRHGSRGFGRMGWEVQV